MAFLRWLGCVIFIGLFLARSYAVEGIVQNGFARYGRTAERTIAAWAAYQLRPVCSR